MMVSWRLKLPKNVLKMNELTRKKEGGEDLSNALAWLAHLSVTFFSVGMSGAGRDVLEKAASHTVTGSATSAYSNDRLY